MVMLVAYLAFGGKDDAGEGGVYQMDRISGWLDPFGDKSGSADTWQIKQSLYAIGSGGLLGVGLGQSRQKYLYLPKPQNDFIFAIVCEELGMVGALVIMLLFALLIWRGVYISLRQRPLWGHAGPGAYLPGGPAGGAEHLRGDQHHSQHGHQPALFQLGRHSAADAAGADGNFAEHFPQLQRGENLSEPAGTLTKRENGI